MAGYIGSKVAVTQVDGYTKSEADARYVEGDDTLYVDQTNDRVGIGTSSPSFGIELAGTGNNSSIRVADTTNNVNVDVRANSTGALFRTASNHPVVFATNQTERMRIDNIGRLLVGKTAQGLSTAGFEVEQSGQTSVTQSGASCIRLNRLSSDGDIIQLRKDTSQIGSIGAVSGDIFIAGPDNNHAAIRLAAGNQAVLPVTTSGSLSDNTTDLGQSNARYDDVVATNGTIQTSDEREKQDIATLTDAEITAAKAISKLFKTFKWKDRVATKGDAARTHTGVIAQDVEQAMTDAGLNAGDYAFFISTTWWETSTEVAAVEADEENGIEAQAAYTRTDTYDTADEAPEGATERNRKGIRYPELLSFIGAATEQRLTSIEDRLDALEAG